MSGAAFEMLRPPGGKRPKVIVNARVEADTVEWAEQFVGKGGKNPSLSEVFDWLAGLGRKQYESIRAFDAQIEEVGRDEGLTEVEALRELVKRGLAFTERENKGKR